MIDWSSHAGNLDFAGLRLIDAIRFVPGEPEPPLLCHLSGNSIARRCSHLRPLSPTSGSIRGAHRERGWTMSVKARWGSGQTYNARGGADPWAAMDVLQRPKRCAKLSEVVISNKMQELSGINGLDVAQAVPPYSGLRSPNFSGLG
jgi:hypothetical protein